MHNWCYSVTESQCHMSSHESQFWHTNVRLPSVHSSWAHMLHVMHWIHFSPDLLLEKGSAQIRQKASSSSLSQSRLALEVLRGFFNTGLLLAFPLLWPFFFPFCWPVVGNVGFFTRALAAASFSISSFSGVSVRIRVLPLFRDGALPLRGPAFGRGRMSCGEHGVNCDCCFLSDELVDCTFSSVAASTSTKHTRHDSQDKHKHTELHLMINHHLLW